jgi:hemoglobin/transferrin/lactoferrin receptor protein
MRIFPATIFLAILGCVHVYSQTEKQISGIVKDQNGAVISGASITLTAKFFERTTTSDAGGEFRFTQLPNAAFDLRASANGFATSVRRVRSDASPFLEVILSIAGIQTTVTAEIGQEVERKNVPQAVNTISGETISRRAPNVIMMAAKEEVGVNVQQTSPTLGGIFVRGLAGKNVAVYIDGVRYTNSAQRGGINTFFNLNEPGTFQSIEILRGASSAQFGSDALGGSINLISENSFAENENPAIRGETNSNLQSADRSYGSFLRLGYGNNRVNGILNIAARRVNTLRSARGIDSHAAVTRFLGLRSDIFGTRLPDTAFTQYSGSFRLNYSPNENSQIAFHYQRGQQDGGKRYDQLLGGDGNLIADLRNLMLDFGYLRFVKQNFAGFDAASFTVSFNSQREERVNQGGQGNPFGSITHQYERTGATGASFYLDKNLPFRNSLVVGGDYYYEKINAPAYTVNPRTNSVLISRPRIPDNARFVSGGLFVQDRWEAIRDRLRFTGAFRYSAADYKARAADAPIVGGLRLWQDDDLRTGAFSGRIGGVVKIAKSLNVAANYGRGFRYPNMTDLGTLGLSGDGFEVDYSAAWKLGGEIGTTADSNSISTGLPVGKMRSEYSNNLDLSFRYLNKRFEIELTGYILDLNKTITKQALILPLGSVGQSLGDQRINDQLPNGVVFVPLSTSPVLVRANYSSARISGIEVESEVRLTSEFTLAGNFTFIHSKDKATGLPPNIEGGTPPPTGFASFKYQPSSHSFWIEFFATAAAKQNRLSSLDLADRRTGATRSRSQIANFFRNGACVRGLTNNADGRCGSDDETILLATGETLAQVQDRVLGAGIDSAPLFTFLPAYVITNLRGGYRFNEKSQIFWAFENMFDRSYRNPSWGIDGAGRNFRLAFRRRF